MRPVFRFAAALLGVVATAYFLSFVHQTLKHYDMGPLFAGTMPGAIALGALSYALIVPTTSWAWGRLLRDTGVVVPVLRLNVIMGMTQIAKYLPGNVGQHLSRSAMALQSGIQAGPLILTLAIELVLAILAAVSIGTLTLLVASHGRPEFLSVPRWALSLAALCSGLALAALPAAMRSIPKLSRRLLATLTSAKPIPVPRWPSLTAAFGAYVLNYLFIGAALYGIARGAGGTTAPVSLFVGAFALSWVAGFLVPGAPAGLGVREGVMTALLTPPLDGATALKVILAFRIATTCGDVLGLMWGAAIRLLGTTSRWVEPADARRDVPGEK